jgi:hypothetical protein
MVQIDYLSDIDKRIDDHHGLSPKHFAPSDMKMEIGDIVLIERCDGAMTLGQVKNIHEDVAQYYPLNRQKFIENKVLAKRLVATGQAELIEGNWWGRHLLGCVMGKNNKNQ